jgi:hypothetical protein
MKRFANICVAIFAAWSAAQPALAQEQPDYKRLVARLSGHMPSAVPGYPISALPVSTRPMFDTFMWQNFIAAVWPALPQAPGIAVLPDDRGALRGGYRDGLVPNFLTWKTADDLYPANGSAPPPWEQVQSSARMCKNVPANDARPRLGLRAKFGTFADEFNQAFAAPLIDQTGLITRYEVRYNRAYYDYVRDNGLYNKANWPTKTPIAFPAGDGRTPGAVMVKAAWRDLSSVPQQYRSRFYQTTALVPQPGSCDIAAGGQAEVNCTCGEVPVGLVGLHVVQKTANFPQFVWSTFEQVDNLGEDPSTPAGMKPSYYNGAKANPATTPGFSYTPVDTNIVAALKAANSINGLGANLAPVNVARLNAIPTTPTLTAAPNVPTVQYDTNSLNQRYRALLAGSVWRHFWLIGTQWSSAPFVGAPTPLQATYKGAPPPDFGCEDGTPAQVGGLAFPACGVANIAMETYHQYDSCQNCHQGAQRSGADFSWSLALRAYVKP